MVKYNYMKTLTKEHRDNISKAMKGIVFSAEHRKNLSLSQFGKKKPWLNGNPQAFKKGTVPWNKGLKGCLSHMSKERHWNWKKDRTKVIVGERFLHDPLQKQWRKEVRARDMWKCRIADGNCCGKLEAHHILPWSEFPELRYQVNNGITLCHFHHPRKKDDVKRLSPFFQELVLNKN